MHSSGHIPRPALLCVGGHTPHVQRAGSQQAACTCGGVVRPRPAWHVAQGAGRARLAWQAIARLGGARTSLPQPRLPRSSLSFFVSCRAAQVLQLHSELESMGFAHFIIMATSSAACQEVRGGGGAVWARAGLGGRTLHHHGHQQRGLPRGEQARRTMDAGPGTAQAKRLPTPLCMGRLRQRRGPAHLPICPVLRCRAGAAIRAVGQLHVGQHALPLG